MTRPHHVTWTTMTHVPMCYVGMPPWCHIEVWRISYFIICPVSFLIQVSPIYTVKEYLFIYPVSSIHTTYSWNSVVHCIKHVPPYTNVWELSPFQMCCVVGVKWLHVLLHFWIVYSKFHEIHSKEKWVWYPWMWTIVHFDNFYIDSQHRNMGHGSLFTMCSIGIPPLVL